MPQAVEIFQLAFAEEHAARFRGRVLPTAFVDVWRFLLDAEPQGFLAAREDGRLLGYAIFVRSLRAIQRKAVLSGAALRWAARALGGAFDLRLRSMWRIVRNKALFLTSERRYRSIGDAQLLNVAVHPQARGRGVATALVSEGLRLLQTLGVPEVRLEVRPWNAAALAVYARTGWREVGRTRDLEGEWVVMVANPGWPIPAGVPRG